MYLYSGMVGTYAWYSDGTAPPLRSPPNSGAIELAGAELNGTDFMARNLTYANLYQSSSATGASGLLGLGFPINGRCSGVDVETTAFQEGRRSRTAPRYRLQERWLTGPPHFPLLPDPSILPGEIWLQMVELEHNLTGVWPTTAESSAYYPIIPLMHAQGTIANNMFSLEVSRLGPDAIFEAIIATGNFTYAPEGGVLTVGDYPEGMR